MDDIAREIIQNPNKAGDKQIKQIVQIFGDGKLTDDGQTAPAFRDFLNNCGIERLEAYTHEIVTDSSDGRIFQDIVNTIGTKLGFEVEHGLYQGKKNAIGFDGYWSFESLNLVIECKTTDTYRISTETLLNYSRQLKDEKHLAHEPQVLLVVGRVDTGDLEAQIRGSRADDRISVIGVENLLRLAKANLELSEGPASKNLKNILLPRDYTRLDDLTSMVTDLIIEAQQTSLDQAELDPPLAEDNDTFEEAKETKKISFPADQLKSRMVTAASMKLGKLEKGNARSKSQFRTSKDEIYYFIASKRYYRTDQQFWYAVDNKWKAEWAKHGGGLAIGMEGKQYFYIIDHRYVLEWTKYLNETVKPNRQYWHLAFKENSNKMELILNKSDVNQDLSDFKINF